MACRIAAILLVFILIGSVSIPTTEAIDCMRFVYHAACRGISAKRAQMPPLQFRDLHRSTNGFTSNFKDVTTGDDQVDYESAQLQDEYLRSLLKRYLSRLGASNGVANDESVQA